MASDSPHPGGAPRFPHYYMAHYALREIALNDPVGVLSKLASPQAPAFIAVVHAFVTEFCKQHNDTPDFRAEDVSVWPMTIGAYPVAVIQMPEPRNITEVYFAALVGLYDVAALDTSAGKPEARYFTLEKTGDIASPTGTIFGEWRGEVHSNYGPGPAASREAFVGRIEEQLGK